MPNQNDNSGVEEPVITETPPEEAPSKSKMTKSEKAETILLKLKDANPDFSISEIIDLSSEMAAVAEIAWAKYGKGLILQALAEAGLSGHVTAETPTLIEVKLPSIGSIVISKTQKAFKISVDLPLEDGVLRRFQKVLHDLNREGRHKNLF